GPAVDDRGGRRIVDGDHASGSVERLREIPLALQEGWDGERQRRPGPEPLPFVRDEKEGLVLLDGAADTAAVHVVAQLGRHSAAVAVERCEEARRVQRIIAEVFVDASMELI